MPATYYHDIFNAIKTMHWRHGIGDVQEIRIYADGRIEVHAQGYRMKPHVRRGRLIGDPLCPFGKQTIKMYRHQLTVIIVGGEPE